MSVDAMIDALIGREGGYVDHPADRGGETIWGITFGTARANGYTGPMRSMPRSVAVDIYRRIYWQQPGFDQVAAVNTQIAEELFDTGVNCGVPFARPLLQRALNLLNRQGADYHDLVVDGVIGPRTLAALRAYVNKRGKLGVAVLHRTLNIMQGMRYIELTERRPTQEAFFYGWIAHRIEGF